MKTYALTVFVADDKLGTISKDLLVQAAADTRTGKTTGPLGCTVKHGPRSEKVSDTGWHITGNALAVDFGDAVDLAGYIDEVNERLANDLGTIGAVSKTDPYADNYKSGQSVDINYVLNHGGLPLAYGDAIKDTFREKKGRQSVAVAVANVQADFNAAMQWAVARKDMTLLAAGADALVKAWREAGKPSETGN